MHITDGPSLALLYNAIETICGIFRHLVQAGYVLYEFYFGRVKEPHQKKEVL